MENLGPGYWYVIHRQGMLAGRDQQAEYIEYVKNLVETIPCDQCRTHGLEFIEKNPPDKRYANFVGIDGKYLGNFVWSYHFHNEVNRRLDKPIPEFKDVLGKYTGSLECESCSVDEKEPEPSDAHVSLGHNKTN